jgi:hypothetical protein
MMFGGACFAFADEPEATAAEDAAFAVETVENEAGETTEGDLADEASGPLSILEAEAGAGTVDAMDTEETEIVSDSFEPLATGKVGFRGSITIDDPAFLAGYNAADPSMRLIKVSAEGGYSAGSNQTAWFWSDDTPPFNAGSGFDTSTGTLSFENTFDYPEAWQSVAGGTFNANLRFEAFYYDGNGTLYTANGSAKGPLTPGSGGNAGGAGGAFGNSLWAVGADSIVDFGSLATSQFDDTGGSFYVGSVSAYQVKGKVRIADQKLWQEFQAADADDRRFFLDGIGEDYVPDGIPAGTFYINWGSSWWYPPGNTSYNNPDLGPIIADFDEQSLTLTFSFFPSQKRQTSPNAQGLFIGFYTNSDPIVDAKAWYDISYYGPKCAYALDVSYQGSLTLDLGEILIGEPPVVPTLTTAPKDWDGSGAAVATIDAPLEDFIRLALDGVEVDKAHYTLTSGSTIITFSEVYLKTLGAGDYTFTAEFTGGTVGVPLKVLSAGSGSGSGSDSSDDSSLPPTGDNWMLVMLAVLTLLGGAATLIAYRRRTGKM